MNRFIMMIEDAAFSALELATIALCLYCISVWWSIT
jgi:uncharacterized membrane protein